MTSRTAVKRCLKQSSEPVGGRWSRFTDYGIAVAPFCGAGHLPRQGRTCFIGNDASVRRCLAAIAMAAVLSGATVAGQRGPAATASNLPAEVLALACAPKAAFGPPDSPLRVTGGQDSSIRHSHAPGDLITINAGSQNGIEVGQEFYTRRTLVSRHEAITRATPGTIITTSWIRVYSVDDTMSLATITHACETVDIGDYLEPFKVPTMPTIASTREKPLRDNYAHVMLGNSRRASFGKGDFFIMDRGSDHGVAPGTQFVLYRNKQQAQNFLYDLGEAVAVDVTADTSTLLVTVSRDAIAEGDLVAIRGMWKEPPDPQKKDTADAQKDEPSQTASLTAPAR
jgi:hypothetical protein